VSPLKRIPMRGEIWFAQLPVDPPGKGRRPVLVVSLDVRNRHERAETVLVIPLTTSIHKEAPTHLFFSAGETGLQADSTARAEDITVLRKQSLVEPSVASVKSARGGFANLRKRFASPRDACHSLGREI
jgi:mRNA-degrading endonuclease toxin of MazEF toxin-antitoxin module